MINEHLKVKDAFPEPPIVSFGKNANLRSILINLQRKPDKVVIALDVLRRTQKNGADHVNYATTWDKSTN